MQRTGKKCIKIDDEAKERSWSMMQANQWKWNQFGMLRTCQALNDYMSGREYGHTKYFHYTKLDVADSILKNRGFWLSNVSGFNDAKDIEQFGTRPVPFFSLCFSTGVNENLPMWYLYSGIDGKGARLQFTKLGIRELVEGCRYSLWLFDGIRKVREIMPLENGKTMDIYFGDVIYAQEPTNEFYCKLKYNTMTNYQIPAIEYEKYREEHRGFQKGLIWYYEKETRLLIRLKGRAEEQWQQMLPLEEGKSIRIVASFDEHLYKKIKVTLAPNITVQEMAAILDGKEEIYKLWTKSSFVQPSQYAGTVKMHLCDRCQLNKKQEKNEESLHV